MIIGEWRYEMELDVAVAINWSVGRYIDRNKELKNKAHQFCRKEDLYGERVE